MALYIVHVEKIGHQAILVQASTASEAMELAEKAELDQGDWEWYEPQVSHTEEPEEDAAGMVWDGVEWRRREVLGE